MGIVCIDEKLLAALTGRLETLSAQAQRLERLYCLKAADGWIEGEDVCRALGITRRTLQTYREKRVIPFTHVGGKYLYRAKDILEYLQKHTVKRQG